MGLFKAIATWLLADAEVKLATADAIARGEGLPDESEEHPEGGFTQAEIGNAMPQEPELHAGYRPGNFWYEDAGHVSLRWHPPC